MVVGVTERLLLAAVVSLLLVVEGCHAAILSHGHCIAVCLAHLRTIRASVVVLVIICSGDEGIFAGVDGEEYPGHGR